MQRPGKDLPWVVGVVLKASHFPSTIIFLSSPICHVPSSPKHLSLLRIITWLSLPAVTLQMTKGMECSIWICASRGICTSLRDLCRGVIQLDFFVWHEHYSARNVYSKLLHIDLPLLFTLNPTEEYLGVCFMHGADGTPVNMIICKSQAIYKH